MKKIAFIGNDLKFISHIINFFETELNYEVRIDQWQGHEQHDVEKSLAIIEWADILFCEWGLGNVVWYQQHKKEHQKLFVRLHRFEMNTKYPAMFDYSKINKLIAISPYIYEEFHRVAKVPREKMEVIYNAVEIDRFNTSKKAGSEFNLGIIGIVPKLKRIDRAFDIFEKLSYQDNRYRLFIKGKHPEEFSWVWNNPVEREFYDKVFDRIEQSPFKDHISFEGWGDVSEWLTNIGYVLSVSDYESFHMVPIEGMASGAYPIVLRREGVNTVFPQKYIFETTDEAVRFIEINKLNDSKQLKQFVEEKYSLKKISFEIDELMERK
ncbi:glycosyltransferase [Bacillus sp. DX1.1]|uniref:glycosyltransferase n=1 Tax=unclassified Bacillus (in: firmicutes) TaxID=185979 RepID=UPI002571251C|nr:MULTISPECIES: glycosyltransferase [unclassified Bacillus (in: firmicutes)]MDM5157397.1 glycosyltransferase [Bacillus sp. DX1.1]WJE81621.1 glycosyltransferase [Bacillus sp. DX3.1]